MNEFAEALKSDRFLITTELNPPKGVDLGPLLEKAEALRGEVDAFNLTDSHTARMSMAPLGAAQALVVRGLAPIVQVTGRDRNRIALQGDLLAAAALGVSNVLCMSGDDPTAGDHPDARGVFDLEAIGILRAVSSLERGEDLGGNALAGAPRICAGAVANPGADDLELELARLGQKVEAGARFFQTQPVFDMAAFERFSEAVRGAGAPILAGVMPLKSAKMAHNLNANVPGIAIPERLIQELDEATDQKAKSIEMCGRIVKQLRPLCRGVHLMAVGSEDALPDVLRAAGIDRRAP